MIILLGVKSIKKVERYKIDDRKFTKNGWISYDMSIHTEKKVQFNRPDIIAGDKRKNRITIVEIGITSQNNLVKTEMEKKDKYQDLGKQMKFQTFGNHDTEIVIIPWVMTWDGVVARELIEKGMVRCFQMGIRAFQLNRFKLIKSLHCTLHHNFTLLTVEVIITVAQGDHYVTEGGASRVMESLPIPRPAVMAQPVELGFSFTYVIAVPLTRVYLCALVIRHVRLLEVPQELVSATVHGGAEGLCGFVAGVAYEFVAKFIVGLHYGVKLRF
ncbi:reverse transcriptase domain containing protein [Babesia caballi]|uniref:Reverse transcriptase domain containing protein n=1 Tax=Babesia caballi TaxID=5871 RepID=A0AAV4LSB2_BABCB|nr:reverse transcriptase domain containing protein [Babesia caballi]